MQPRGVAPKLVSTVSALTSSGEWEDRRGDECAEQADDTDQYRRDGPRFERLRLCEPADLLDDPEPSHRSYSLTLPSAAPHQLDLPVS